MALHRPVARVLLLFFVVVATPMAVLAQSQPPPPPTKRTTAQIRTARCPCCAYCVVSRQPTVIGPDGIDLFAGARAGRSLGERE